MLLLGTLTWVVTIGGCGAPAGQPESLPPALEPPQLTAEPPPAEVEYRYQSVGKRDPFRSFVIFCRLPELEDPLTPLQQFELDELRLTGILWSDDAPVALIETPDGVGHPTHLGDLVGRAWGKVDSIDASGVVVREEYRDPIDNNRFVEEVRLDLPITVASR